MIAARCAALGLAFLLAGCSLTDGRAPDATAGSAADQAKERRETNEKFGQDLETVERAVERREAEREGR